MNKRSTTEYLPWYRRPDYNGKMSESEKRKLDRIRDQDVHPAFKYENLPSEVQTYISRLRVENYDHKQNSAASMMMVGVLFGSSILLSAYFGFNVTPATSIWRYLVGVGIIVACIVFFRREWSRNADAFLPKDDEAPSSVNEQLKQEWELDYLVRIRRAEEANPTDFSKT